MNPALKRAAEYVLLHGGVARAARGRMRGRSLVLAYHNVVPDGERPVGETSLHIPQRRFAEQLDALQHWCRVVPITDVLTDQDGEPRAAITFDDAYLGAVTTGIAEVARRGLPATIFVATGRLEGNAFWWDSLAPAGGEWKVHRRTHALQECRGVQEAVEEWMASEHGASPARLPPHACAARLPDLEAALQHPGITLGSHTVRHPNLTCLAAAELQHELQESKSWLEERFGGAAVPWLAYPYGITTEEVAAAAAALGYAGAFRVSGGWLPRQSPARYELPRLNVPSRLSSDGFALRISGLLAG
jgi:peptidoglycan/xylan/chitin deacetylase (PgdA/CDA1 family)